MMRPSVFTFGFVDEWRPPCLKLRDGKGVEAMEPNEFTCPNCGATWLEDLPACPGCGLTWEELEDIPDLEGDEDDG